jgi:Holliday junction DNA helicase RuvA
MYEYLIGKLVSSKPSKAVVDVGGIGFSVTIMLRDFSKLPKLGESVQLFTSFIVREDAHLLFGFLSQGEKELFEKLIAISGVGPKTAMALLGHLEPADLELALMNSNTALLSKVPGIGKKTAERLVVELRDKIKLDSAASAMPITGDRTLFSDAISALINLGYHPAAAQKAVKKVLDTPDHPAHLGQVITSALRSL